MDIAPDPVAIPEPAGAVALPGIDAVEPDEPREAAAEPEAPAEGTIIDCTCWPHPKSGLVPPQPLDQVLPEVWKPLGKTCDMLNQVVQLIRAHRSRQSGDASTTAVAIKAVATTVPTILAVAMITVHNAPGYLLPKPQCKHTFEQHLKCLAHRDETLRTYEETLEHAMVEAQPLAEANAKFLKQEADHIRRKAVHMTVRAAAIASLPFAPVLSATLTAIDVLGLSIYIGVQEVISSVDELRPVFASINELQNTLHEKVAEAQGFRRELVAIRERVEWQRTDPSTSRLSDIQRELQNVIDVAQETLGDGSATSKRSLREVADAMREFMILLGDPPEGVTSLVDVEDSEWIRLDETMAELGATSPRQPS
ncbi:uncharacterized protein TRAVEDRAFT_40608 [Trametes versicolor FP-101664 SS1]|uniref:uncharacterized protein n=1 Tax=Trametes versicolor (strain FP-101664) TaxID=717944 RepID=UPI000462340F|nr:uncharacterized protein TRAVEDRAFT_40608 [Trametes versicolor FP-101664 SS1]EIW52203.1 hypothetical protein TRAVEDRAFT_40608 [Trametes versicolor FP-101664 SS1]